MTKMINVLIVEDEVIVSMDIQESLVNLGYNVLGTTPSGEDAIDLAEKLHPDMILMDIKLKGEMSGIDAASIIKKRFNIPIIYLTGNSSDEIIDQAMITEPYSFLIKPINKEELNSAIKIGVYKHKMDMMFLQMYEKIEIAYKELKTMDGMKKNIISRASRELKTPISIGLSSMEFALKENDNEDVKRYINMANNAMDGMARIVNNLIVESENYRDIEPVDKELIFLEDIVQLILAELKYDIREKDIEVETNIGDINIYANYERIKIALYNIIENAVKFSKERGNRISISAWSKKGFVEIIIEDAGIGIQEEHYENIFKTLFQVEQSSTRKFSGLGMGLSAAKLIVNSHDGKIWVESDMGKGSMFHISLPNKND